MDSGVTMVSVRIGGSMPQAVAALQEEKREQRETQCCAADHQQADPRRDVGQSEKAVTKAVDHIEERIEVRHFLPELRERMDRIENTGEKGQRQDEEILESGELIEFFRP